MVPFAHPAIDVATSPLHGRGLFAVADIPADTHLARVPLLILSAADTMHLRQTRLHHYVFHIRDEPDGEPIHAVAFGVISMCNHASPANAAFRIDEAAQEVLLTAAVAIPAGAEIFIDYGDFASEAV